MLESVVALLMRIFLVCAICLPLSGCLDVEIDLTLSETGQVEARGNVRMMRQMYDLMAPGQRQDFCDEHQLTIGEVHVTCQFGYGGSLDSLEEYVQGPNTLSVLSIRRDSDQVEIRFDLNDIKNVKGLEVERRGSIPPGAIETVRAALGGYSITLQVEAPEIVETNGTLSADATQARLVIPIIDILLDKKNVPERFYAVATGVE